MEAKRTMSTVHTVDLFPNEKIIGKKISIQLEPGGRIVSAKIISVGDSTGMVCTDTNKCTVCSADFCPIRNK